jgi:hypothetical protein
VILRLLWHHREGIDRCQTTNASAQSYYFSHLNDSTSLPSGTGGRSGVVSIVQSFSIGGTATSPATGWQAATFSGAGALTVFAVCKYPLPAPG